MELKSSFILILGIFLISFVSANGLVIEPNSINITKIAGEDYYFNLNIKNTETFAFQDIQFLDTIGANKFSLLSGENKTIQFRIINDQDVNKTVRLRGVYTSNLGQSNRSESVSITYPNGADKCNLNLVVGDSITWTNNVPGEIKLRNSDTNLDITTITAGSTYTIRFTEAQSFNYQILRLGIPFTQTCNLNIMGTSGLIHNTDLDGLLNLNLTVLYPETNISVFFLQDSYNLSYNEDYQDVMSIRNTGSKIAKNIKLSGNWITFDKNNLDILPGQSVNVGYTVKPMVYETGQTNQLYSSNITISGNFQEQTQNISIFVKYANIGTGMGNLSVLDDSVLQFLVQTICGLHPEFVECKRPTSGSNSTIREVSTIFTEDTIFELIQRQDLTEEDEKTFKKQQNELISNMTNSITNMSMEMKGLREENSQLKEQVDNSNASTIFLGIMFISIALIGVITFLIIKNKGRLKIFGMGKFHKGERPL